MQAATISVGKMNEKEALSLFFGRSSVARGSPQFGQAQQIVAELDYMLLAINLARAYINEPSKVFGWPSTASLHDLLYALFNIELLLLRLLLLLDMSVASRRFESRPSRKYSREDSDGARQVPYALDSESNRALRQKGCDLE